MLSEYFKARIGFKRLLEELKKKYISLGRFSGSITISNITEEEAIALSDFFGERILVGSTYHTSFKKIEKILKQTKFCDFTWEELFSDYFKTNIVSKKEQKMNEKKEEQIFFEQIIKETPSSNEWLMKVLEERNKDYQFLIKRYHKDKRQLKFDLIWILKLIDMIEQVTPTTLSILSSYSGNPHFLDFGTANSMLFFKILSSLNQKEVPKTNEEKILFLEQFQIYVDNFSNFVITYQLRSESELVEVYAREHQPLILNLYNLSSISTLDTKEKKVFVFENPSMLSIFQKKQIPIIITSGFPNLAVYQVLEKLVKSGNTIYYNGDFDPEGLWIAHRLKKSFPIRFFCYEKEDFEQVKSSETISESRLKKLEQINDDALQEMKNILKKEKVAGYQEQNEIRIEQFIEHIINS